ncbi:ABC transporter permease [Microbulbifer sp. MLAF003]|uniref:ABC transporter permease n=1 Tax=unclassified Microbulbifer TaxID=2619833 RepID=UPI0024AD5FE6|nr:ABC transporter permease [Microbulbifer sp. MLAF003]WHI50806.1 ABC transporter permease [Microbulbifer sp. MLAF003]
MSIVDNVLSQQFQALVLKELLEVWRDRRALMIALGFTLLFPAIMIGSGALSFKVVSETNLNIAIVGSDYAPLLENQLHGTGFRIDQLREGIPRELLEDKYDAVLQIGKEFETDYRNLLSPKVYLYVDGSSKSGGRGIQLIQERLGTLQKTIMQQRLSARGIAPQVLTPWQLQIRDVSTPSSRGLAILGIMVPVLLIMALMVCSAAPSIDTSAGERERMSIETLLQQPLNGWQIIVAKVLAVTSIGWFGSLLSLAVLTLSFTLLPLAEIGVQFSAGITELVAMSFLLLPLALLVAVLQILLALRSQSFKDAQIQLSILQGLPVALLMIVNLSDIKLDSPAWQLTPLIGQQQWLSLLMAGEAIPVPLALAGSLVTLSLVGLCILVGARALSRESLLGAT